MEKNGENSARLLLLGNAREVHLKRWAEYFSESGYRVLTISLESEDSFPGEKFTPRIPGFLPGFVRYPLAVPYVRKQIASFKPHIVNAHFLPNYGVIASLVSERPWILSAWGSDVMLLPQKSLFHMRRTRFVLSRAAFITSDAEVMSKKLIELGANPGRILTVPFGVDRSLFHPAEKKQVQDGPRILCTRKLEKIYNVEAVVEAFPLVKNALPQATLTVAGAGPLRKSLREKIEEVRCSEDVSFLGYVSHSRIPGLLRSHDLYVSMSHSDSTSVSLLEAMACGLFPVVSDLPANREWIQDGRNGFLVPANSPTALAKALIQAWKSKGLLESSVSINQEIIEKKADWFENMGLVRALFERIGEQSGAPL